MDGRALGSSLGHTVHPLKWPLAVFLGYDALEN
jgi:hypothetical protein